MALVEARGRGDVPCLRHTNEVIDAYVTAGVKIHLYRYLDRMRENDIYCDKDSVIYIQPRDDPALIETCDKLEDMTTELRPSEFISVFSIDGPKNYTYRAMTGRTGEKNSM